MTYVGTFVGTLVDIFVRTFVGTFIGDFVGAFVGTFVGGVFRKFSSALFLRERAVGSLACEPDGMCRVHCNPDQMLHQNGPTKCPTTMPGEEGQTCFCYMLFL